MSLYNVSLAGDVLTIGFGDEPGQNDSIVPEAAAKVAAVVEGGGLAGIELLKVNGPASLPVAMAVAHAVGHQVKGVACYDPKLNGYVVSIAHGPEYTVGQLIPA